MLALNVFEERSLKCW